MKKTNLILIGIILFLLGSVVYAAANEDSVKRIPANTLKDNYDYNKTLLVPDYNLRTVFFRTDVVIPQHAEKYRVQLNISQYGIVNDEYIFVPNIEIPEDAIDQVRLQAYIRDDSQTVSLYFQNTLDNDTTVTINGNIIGDLV